MKSDTMTCSTLSEGINHPFEEEDDDLKKFKKIQRLDSSVDKASERKARKNTDAAAMPGCGKRFFCQSQLFRQTHFLCAIACISICARVTNNPKHW